MTKSSKGLFKTITSFIAALPAMVGRTSRSIGAALANESGDQETLCPIQTAVEFGLRVPRKNRDAPKKVFY
ncbi:MAG TPA: hypothetical protein VGG27_00670 [Magnetospirillaceae bacterium]